MVVFCVDCCFAVLLEKPNRRTKQKKKRSHFSCPDLGALSFVCLALLIVWSGWFSRGVVAGFACPACVQKLLVFNRTCVVHIQALVQ